MSVHDFQLGRGTTIKKPSANVQNRDKGMGNIGLILLTLEDVL